MPLATLMRHFFRHCLFLRLILTVYYKATTYLGDPWTHDQDDIIGNEREEKHFQIVIAIVKVCPQIPQSYPSRMLVNQLSLYWSDCDELILH